MNTKIYRHHPIVGAKEVPRKDIDYWCGLCQFPIEPPKCTSQTAIQQCWSDSDAGAGEWHKRHECPFIHRDQPCRCNDYLHIPSFPHSVSIPLL